MRCRSATLLVGGALVVASCVGGSELVAPESVEAPATSDAVGAVEIPATADSVDTISTVAIPASSVVGDEDAEPDADVPLDDAPTDWALPSVRPEQPEGALGFDRYVWTAGDDGEVIPVVVEGPRGEQQRCQDPVDSCSYQELKALAESNDPLPDGFVMTRDDLVALVSQLDLTAATVNSLPTPADACAAGYEPVSAQNPNMGVHFVNVSLLSDDFDPANPEMLLYASEDALGAGRTQLGVCGADGGWTGMDGLEVVGSAFFIGISDDHPDAFDGPYDQWHVHYNSCAGGEFDSAASEDLCGRNGGVFFDVQPNWMIHAYVADGFDSDTGVFAMWNNSVWPLETGGSSVEVDGPLLTITDFAFDPVVVEAGADLTFSNSDQMPHTVVSGSPAQPTGAFESALIGSGAQWAQRFDQPGEYAIYCSLHPTMTGTVVVE